MEDILGKKVKFTYPYNGAEVEDALILQWGIMAAILSNNPKMDDPDRRDLFPEHREYKYRWMVSPRDFEGDALQRNFKNFRPFKKLNHE